jgi:hypothetical protein
MMAARRRLQAEERVMATGLPAQGIIVDVHETGATSNDQPFVALHLYVDLPGHERYRTDFTEIFSPLVFGRLQRGATLPLRVDPGDLAMVFVDVPAMLGERPSSPPAQRGGGPSERADPLEKLERLAKLREESVLTEAEFTAKKAELLRQRF